MGRLGVLLMARLLARVFPAVKRSTTHIWTLESAYPLLHGYYAIFGGVRLLALLLFRSVTAENIFLYLTTIATRRNSLLARSTWTLVTWP
jgi:hypothetical protein